MPDKALMTVHSVGGPPSLEQAAHELGVTIEAMDEAFGVILLDHKRGLYGVQVDAANLPPASPAAPYRGPFSDPHIEPFGPVNSGLASDDQD